jgi:hypothetical protein
MHGAAIAHGVFQAPGAVSLELKTLYGYDSILFALVADSRRGLHAQVDIRKYFTPGGTKPVDDSLVNRTMRVLDKALYFQHKLSLISSHHKERSEGVMVLKGKESKDPITDRIVVVNDQFKGDLVIGPALFTDETARHILGPYQSNQTAVCDGMLFSRLRKVLVPTAGHSFHCDICTNYVVRQRY